MKPYPGMLITQDVTFDPGIYDFSCGEGMCITASGITIEGNGAILIGPGKLGYTQSFLGTAIRAEGQDNVVIRDLHIHGFQLALHVLRANDWIIENNDFSYNYSDEDYDWGEGFPYGAILMRDVCGSLIQENVAKGNWNGLDMRNCNNNRIVNNIVSHCTNVCLKMWRSSRNWIADNDFSHGIRIRPSETHARDSTCALIEAGSDFNRFYRNDFTFGGDGVFIRPLNGWQSSGNYFEENDASFAHNNAWECWSPGNSFVRNKANYSSYGFWMGGSDETLLQDNEISYNGTWHHNAPERDFVHAGVAVVHGSSTHFHLIGNRIFNNKGAGVALGFSESYPAAHWIIQKNEIVNNDGNGIYCRNARGILIFQNSLQNNHGENLVLGAYTSCIQTVEEDLGVKRFDLVNFSPIVKVCVDDSAEIVSPKTYKVNRGGHLTFRLVFEGDWQQSTLVTDWLEIPTEQPACFEVIKTFESVGFFRISVTVHDGTHAAMDWLHLYVIEPDCDELGTEDESRGKWIVQLPEQVPEVGRRMVSVDYDHSVALMGKQSVRIRSNTNKFVLRFCPEQPIRGQSNNLQMWARIRHEAVFGLRGVVHCIRLGSTEKDYYEYHTGRHLFQHVTYSEAWSGWQLISIALSGNDEWTRHCIGNPNLDRLEYIDLIHDYQGEDEEEEDAKFTIWLDGLQII